MHNCNMMYMHTFVRSFVQSTVGRLPFSISSHKCVYELSAHIFNKMLLANYFMHQLPFLCFKVLPFITHTHTHIFCRSSSPACCLLQCGAQEASAGTEVVPSQRQAHRHGNKIIMYVQQFLLKILSTEFPLNVCREIPFRTWKLFMI